MILQHHNEIALSKWPFYLGLIFLIACSPVKNIQKTAKKEVIDNPVLQSAHVGISVYDTETGKYIYNYQGDKFFVPASNTKIPTCYVAMKYLGDSLVAGRLSKDNLGNDSVIVLHPSGDPTFLHPDFTFQPLYEKLKNLNKLQLDLSSWESNSWGNGWSWNDYDQAYMVERYALPIYGNLFNIYLSGDTVKSTPEIPSMSLAVDRKLQFDFNSRTASSPKFSLERSIGENLFQIKSSTREFRSARIPIRFNWEDIDKILEDALNINNVFPSVHAEGYIDRSVKTPVHSQPTDSMLKPMMHRSDNFFAEQSLLMVSNELLGVMNDAQIIDTILKTDFKDLPQRPRWADGSGLSRYNLFTPQDFVVILNKMKNEFGMERIKEIFPTGNDGTLRNYYINDSGYIYAKTGTLSGVVALSGFLYTQNNRLLIFSVLVNNHRAGSADVRRTVERFIQDLRRRY